MFMSKTFKKTEKKKGEEKVKKSRFNPLPRDNSSWMFFCIFKVFKRTLNRK